MFPARFLHFPPKVFSQNMVDAIARKMKVRFNMDIRILARQANVIMPIGLGSRGQSACGLLGEIAIPVVHFIENNSGTHVLLVFSLSLTRRNTYRTFY
jgi:hypothetical protein